MNRVRPVARSMPASAVGPLVTKETLFPQLQPHAARVGGDVEVKVRAGVSVAEDEEGVNLPHAGVRADVVQNALEGR
jgi:hypothetical protein